MKSIRFFLVLVAPLVAWGCTTAAPQNDGGGIGGACTFNGQPVAAGASVEAYATSTVPEGSQCTAETRTCESGVLSGTAPFALCTVGGPAACLFNGQTIADGVNVTAYEMDAPAQGQQCVSEVRTCSNGVLSGSFGFAMCTGAPLLTPCTFNGQSVASGASVKAYQAASASLTQTCTAEDRVCTNGTLSGSFTFASCLQHKITRLVPLSFGGGALVDDKLLFWDSPSYHFTDAQKATVMTSKLDNGVIKPAVVIASGLTDFSVSYSSQCQIANGALGCSHRVDATTLESSMLFATGAKSVTAGWYFSCAIVGNDLQCWSYTGALAFTTPLVVLSDPQIPSVSISVNTVCAVVTGGAVKCAVSNSAQNGFDPPVTIIAAGASKVSTMGFGQGCALVGSDLHCFYSPQGGGSNYGVRRTDGSLKTTGGAELFLSGVLDVSTSRFTGAQIACVVKTDTSVACWGDLTGMYSPSQTADPIVTVLASGAAKVDQYSAVLLVGMKDGTLRSTWSSTFALGASTVLYPVQLE